MHFTTLAPLAALTAVATMANAVDLRTYSNTVSCSGSWFGCGSIGAGGCCSAFPSGYGYSSQAINLPTGTQSIGHTAAGCWWADWQFGLWGPGTKCWNSGGGSRTVSMNWWYSPTRIAGRATVDGNGNVTVGAVGAAGQAATECMAVDQFGYTDAQGNERIIKVGEGEAEAIAKLHASKNLAALEKYEDVSAAVA